MKEMNDSEEKEFRNRMKMEKIERGKREAEMAREFDLSLRENSTEIEHTMTNYIRLLNHPRWKDCKGTVKEGFTNLGEYMTYEMFIIRYTMWLESYVFRGRGASVRTRKVKDAILSKFGEK